MKTPRPLTYEDLFLACSNTIVIVLGLLGLWWSL